MSTEAETIHGGDSMVIDLPGSHLSLSTVGLTGCTAEELRAVHTIQRSYRFYRLRKLIEDLHKNEPWFFHWNRTCPEETKSVLTIFPQLELACLQNRFQDEGFFSKIQRLMELLGSAKSASKCHAKMLLMAFTLNHYGQLPSAELYKNEQQPPCFPELAANINTLGSRFLTVCSQPLCFFSRIRFIVAYSMYSKKFLMWKSSDAQRAITVEARNLVTSVMAINRIKEEIRKQGTLRFSKYQKTLGELKTIFERQFRSLSENLGSVERARELVGLEYKRRKFLVLIKDLKLEEAPQPPTEELEIFYENTTRMVVFQRISTKTLSCAFIGSREENIDPQGFELWYGNHYNNLVRLKEVIHNQFNKCQVLWIPKLVDHVRTIMMKYILPAQEADRFEQSIDYEFIIQQCTMNNFNPKHILLFFISYMKPHCMDHRIKDLNLVEMDLENCVCPQKDSVLPFLEVLENMRVDSLQLMYHVNIKSLVTRSKKLELSLFMKNLAEDKTDLVNLLRWATSASADDKCLLPENIKMQKKSNIDKLALFYSFHVACFPNPDKLSLFPETFTMLRMPVLRTQLLIRDTVIAFSILQFTIGLSKDERRANRIKTALFKILADEHRHTCDNTIVKIIDVISIERPGMTESERQLLHGLIGRIMSKGCPKEQVPKLALQRIRVAIQRRVLHVEPDDSCRMLEHFDGEVKRIVDQAENIWKLSIALYKPIYETLINFLPVWQ